MHIFTAKNGNPFTGIILPFGKGKKLISKNPDRIYLLFRILFRMFLFCFNAQFCRSFEELSAAAAGKRKNLIPAVKTFCCQADCKISPACHDGFKNCQFCCRKICKTVHIDNAFFRQEHALRDLRCQQREPVSRI